jgi:hypothetical protein
MHPALVKLILFQGKALAQRTVRGATSPRGIAFLVLALTLLMVWLIRGISQAYVGGRFPPEKARTAFPLAMLAICGVNLITSVGERAVAFLPPEVDFLFAGPFSRRQLLGYKLLKSGFGALFTASIFSVVFVRYAQLWAAGWLGIFLALLFLQLLSMAVVLIGQTIGERAYTRGRTAVLAGLIALVAIGMAPVLRSGGIHSLAELAAAFRTSMIGRGVLAPFDVFARIVVAPALFPDALAWAALAASMIVVLALLVMWLDAHYLETSAAAGQRIYDRVRHLRRGLGPLRASPGARWRLPRPPRLAGAGPMAWRQLTVALRQSRAVILRLLVICAASAIIFETGDFGGNSGSVTGVVVGALLWLTFMFSSMLPFDFRGDVDHIDTLKALPVSATALCAAQLIAPVAVMAICQLSLLAVVSAVLAPDPRLIVVVVAFIVPFNLLLIAVENLIFLVFPVRLNPVSPGDLEGWGRQMLVFVLKMLSLTILCGVAVGLGFLVFVVGGSTSSVTFMATTVTIMLLEAVGFVPVLALAFRRFDPSLHTPV